MKTIGIALRLCWVGIGLLFFTSTSQACVVLNAPPFQPTLEKWERHGILVQLRKDGNAWEEIPAPVVRVGVIKRGKKEHITTCDPWGTIAVAVSLPEEATYHISEFGVYFRGIDDDRAKQIFPTAPVTGTLVGKQMTIPLVFYDGGAVSQVPLDLRVEVFLVTNGLDIGKSTIVKIKAPAG